MIIILMGMSEWTLAQEQNNIWFFGNKAGLDFNSTPPRPLESDLFTLEGTASISDPAGHLLFYTNGASIWDREHNVMPNGTGLLGGESSTQAALIVPLPKSCNQYYLFATEDHNTNGGLTYSVIDMCLNNGLGDVVASEKNKLIVDRSAEKITAVLHANEVDIWILTHTLGSSDFLAYLLSDAGLNTTPVVSSIGSFYPSDGHIGPVKASHDGSKIVSSSTFRDICEMFDFNLATGQLSNFYDINQLFNIQHWVYGIEFSPNDSLLYLSTCFVTNYLYQLNIKSKQIITLNTTPGHYHYGALQMGPDNKIYMARNDSAFLDVIHQPDLPGLGCQYVEGGQNLSGGTTSQLGLPNFVPYSFFQNSNTVLTFGIDTTLCIGESHTLEITVPPNCETTSILWNDGSTESELVVNQPGLYWVEAESTCSTFRDSIQIDFVACQPECGTSIGSLFGTPDGNERGYCLVANQENDGFYVAGIKDDSIRILKVNLTGAVEWSRTFDIIPNKSENVNSILLDTEGMLAITGTAGASPIGSSVFAFRYNPGSNQILWAKEYIHTPGTNNFCVIQKGNGGNYIMANNPYYGNIDDCEILELNINNGNVVPAISLNYDLGSSDNLSELVYSENFVYGTGRFTDGTGFSKMRHALAKLDATNGDLIWMKLGHLSANQSARLYSEDLIIDEGTIYYLYHGDPSGTSASNTKLYVQKTNLDGDLIWLNQYELPGLNDDGYEIIKSWDGFIVLAGNRGTPTNLVLFKINSDGALLWAKRYNFPDFINEIGLLDWRTSQLIEVDDKLVFTGYASNSSGGNNMILIITDLEGKVDNPCINNESISIPVLTVNSPSFYQVNPTQYSVNISVNSLNPEGVESDVVLMEECIMMDTLHTSIFVTICDGENYEGYTQTGNYSDTFISIEGCDSTRILNLEVDMPEKFQDVSICSGGEFENYSMAGNYIDTIPGLMSDCDTLRYLSISMTPPLETFINREICNGDSFLGYDTTGIFVDTFQTIEGCDSIRILNLFVTNKIFINADIVICLGDNYRGYDEAGVYVDTLQAVFGCDSIVTLQLYIVPVETMIEVEICSGGNFENYSLPGIFVDTLKGVTSPCDTIRQITLTVLPPVETMVGKSICTGENYFGYSMPGIYTDTIATNAGCDSIRTVQLEVTNQVSTTIEASVCEGSLSGYTSAGTYIDTLVTQDGCDSIRTLVLTGGSKYIPNVFSPNDDGINDLFTVFQFPDNSLQFEYFGIFDRFGDMTYETDQWPINWNGKRSGGQPYQPAVFTYILIYHCGDNRVIEHGNITILK